MYYSISIIVIILCIWNILFGRVVISWYPRSISNFNVKTMVSVVAMVFLINNSFWGNKIEIFTRRNIKSNSYHWWMRCIKLIFVIFFYINIRISCKCSIIRRKFKTYYWICERCNWYQLFTCSSSNSIISTIIIKYSSCLNWINIS